MNTQRLLMALALTGGLGLISAWLLPPSHLPGNENADAALDERTYYWRGTIVGTYG